MKIVDDHGLGSWGIFAEFPDTVDSRCLFSTGVFSGPRSDDDKLYLSTPSATGLTTTGRIYRTTTGKIGRIISTKYGR